MFYAGVIVDVANSQVDRIFDYIIPDNIEILRGMRVLIPFGPRKIEGYVINISNTTQVPKNKLKCIIDKLDDIPSLTYEALLLAHWMKDKYRCLLIDAIRVMIPAQMRGDRVKKRTERYAIAILKPDATESIRGIKQKKIFEYLSSFDEAISIKQISAIFENPNIQIKSLEEKGYIKISEVRSYRTPYSQIKRTNENHFTPNYDQANAIDIINNLIGTGGECLLHGVTGSGKTEVYMQCASMALNKGKSVIILVPEISLTPQMVRRFTSRFSNMAAVLHSRLSAGERFDEWQRLRNGEAKVAIGARSAIFAPVENVGLIVIDEEHESTYRSQTRPRYDALEVAKWRSMQNKAALVLGSATPSITSYYSARRGQINLIELPKRIGSAVMPLVKIIDMRDEFAKGNKTIISQSLFDALDNCLKKDQQAILFLNRRGHSTFVSCRECGYVCECEFCDLPMTYHKNGNMLNCHYCGNRQEPPAICPKCASTAIRFFGGGTQKIQEQINKLFPDVKTLRMDADTTTKKDSHLKILDEFAAKKAQILIGTQMIAKGLDFPDVTIVGVIAADTCLYMNDIYSAEKTFQLVSQVSGRAGRNKLFGTVIVQTYSPEHYAIIAASKHDYTGFYEHEIRLREMGIFPPFSQFSRYVISNEDEESAKEDANLIKDYLRDEFSKKPHVLQGVMMLEATPAPYAKIRGLYRYQVLIKHYKDIYIKELVELIDSAKSSAANQSTCILELNTHDII